MARIPFPEGLVGSENLPHTRRELRNCFNNLDGVIIPRPGINSLNTTGSIARGQFVWNGALYQVTGTSLIKITNVLTGAFSTIGTIAGSDNVETAVGFVNAVIVVKNATGKIYTLDKLDVLVDISGNSNFVPCIDVAHINGRFVYIPFDGEPAFFSDVGLAGTVQVLSFFDAEELPDLNNSVFNYKNTLYIGGTDSFELFRDTGASPNPFGRIPGSRITNGFIGALIEYNETFLFIGREKDQDFGIYAIGQGTAPKISNETIDLVLSTYSQAELAAAIGGRIKWRGYDIATIRLARDSFGFFGGNWFVLDTVIGGVSKPWSGGFITQFEGKYYSAFEGNIGVFERINTDYGSMITRIIDTAFEEENNDWFACQSIDLGISQGFNSTSQQTQGPELITNGTFDADLTGWTDGSSAGGSIAQNSGVMDLINTTGAARAVQTVTSVIGKTYLVKFTPSGLDGGSSQQLYLGSTLNGGEFESATVIVAGVNSFTITATTTLISISFRNFAAATTFSIDDVTITQTTLTAEGTVAIFLSKNNVTYGQPFFRGLGRTGEYARHLSWNYPGGMGSYDGFMGVRIYTTEDVEFPSDSFIANLR